MKKILVPIDGSEGSNLAIDKAKELAQVFESEVVLLHVSDSSSTLIADQDDKSGKSPGIMAGAAAGAGMGVGAGMGAGMGSGMGAGGASGVGLVGVQSTDQSGQTVSKSAEKILESGKARFTVLGDKVSVVELQGKTAESIIDFIETDKEIDLVIMGSRGMSDFKRFFVGSVTQKVTESIDRSIMIVK